jgi:hypothetical protein
MRSVGSGSTREKNMRKQKLYFVGDGIAPKTRQYVGVSNVRSVAEGIAAEFGEGYVVYVRMVVVGGDD